MTEQATFLFGSRLAETVASNIRAEVARAGYDQRDLARVIGVSQAAISARWHGKTKWTLDDIDAVASLLGISPTELVKEHKKSARRMASTPGLYTAWDSNPEPSDLGFSQVTSLHKVTDLLAYKVRKAV